MMNHEYIHVIPAEPNLFATVVWGLIYREPDDPETDSMQYRIVGWGVRQNGVTYPILAGFYDQEEVDLGRRMILVPHPGPEEFMDHENGETCTIPLARRRMARAAREFEENLSKENEARATRKAAA
jgi:hypothetical protein